MTKQEWCELREHVDCVKDLFSIAKMAGPLREEGYLDLPDSNEMALQASSVGMEMWKKLWDHCLKDDTYKIKDNQKIDRGTHVVVK